MPTRKETAARSEGYGRPLRDRVLIKRAAAPEMAGGGRIIIPDQHREKPNFGEVVRVGSKAEDVKPGDRVLFGKYSGSAIEIGGVEHLLIREDEILMVLED
jgi:chaperonin GroES